MLFITDAFFEVAIESWPEWDLNPRPLNSVLYMYIYIYTLQIKRMRCTFV